jgi:RNA polymerase sigma factor (sigma-70 family)
MEAGVNAAAGMRFGGRPALVAVGGDERLAQLAAVGSERAFAALYERYHDQLYRYCRSIVRDDSDAQDALQSTLTGAFVALRNGRRDAPLRPWLFRIAHNESVSVLRRRRPEEQLSEMLTDSMGSAHERVEQRERFALLMADLHELPERQRGALVMRELNDLSHEQIAVALRTSVGAVKQTIFEARRALLEFAEGRTMACEDLQRTISDADGRVLRGRRVRAHLRGCPACEAFAAGISARRAALRAVAPPLPAIAASNLLARVLAGAAGEAANGAGGVVAGVAGKTAAAALASKAVAGVVIVTTATVGTTIAGTYLTQPSGRTARETPVRAVDRAPFTSGAGSAARIRRAPDGPVSPPAGRAAASPQAGRPGQAPAASSPVASGAGGDAGQGSDGSTAGTGGVSPGPPPSGRSSTAPDHAASPADGHPATPGHAASPADGHPATPGHAASPADGHPATPGHAASPADGHPATPGHAASPADGHPATPGHAASPGTSRPPAPQAASGGATPPQRATTPAPPGRAASQGSSQSAGPPPDPGGAASQAAPAERGASHSAARPAAPPAVPAQGG